MLFYGENESAGGEKMGSDVKKRAKKMGVEFARTDLACESWDGRGGVEYREERMTAGCVQVTVAHMNVVTRTAAERLGRRRGNYVTVAPLRGFSEIDDTSAAALSNIIGNELRQMAESVCGCDIDAGFGVLVAGLGNSEMTADAVGPATAGKVSATRHLRELEPGIYRALGCSAVSVVAPGVLGRTGMESSDILRGAIRAAKPDLLIAIDALAARSCERLGKTIQLTDSGITPGSGVGNERRALTHSALGIPVISIGVPTVVDSSTLVCEALERSGMTDIFTDDGMPEALRRVLENGRSFFVSPREADVITGRSAEIIANAINAVFGIGETGS